VALRLKLNATIGFIQGENLPISEEYYLGGNNSVRGYLLRSIAPAVPVGSNSSDPASTTRDLLIGGNKQLVFNNELEFPIAEKVGIRGVLFYDLGNVYADDRSFFDEPNYQLPLGMFHSTGFGFRWFSPIGPLRFEWGFPLTPRPQDEGMLFEFTIGNSF
jgi:outer membrane protein insertion porin family